MVSWPIYPHLKHHMLPVAVGLDSIERTHSLWQWVPLDDSPSFLFKNCGWYFHDPAPSNCVREERRANISMPSQLGDAMVWVGLVPIKNHGDTWFPAELYWEMRPSGSDKGHEDTGGLWGHSYSHGTGSESLGASHHSLAHVFLLHTPAFHSESLTWGPHQRPCRCQHSALGLENHEPKLSLFYVNTQLSQVFSRPRSWTNGCISFNHSDDAAKITALQPLGSRVPTV